MKILIVIFFFNIIHFHCLAISDSSEKKIEYRFIIMDSPTQLFTMRQINEDYLSFYRIFARELDKIIEKKYYSDLTEVILTSFLFMPLTHEEGHRSILTVNNIGSISQPYFNTKGAAYVKGVTDSTLINLRDKDLPTYIRLHTGGLESDYMLTKRAESVCIFGQDSFENIKWEYWMRKLGILQYYITGLFHYEADLSEEKNELERDIVGYDTYGAARHIFRPEMQFYRYTKYKNLTSEERSFVNRMGWRSLLNLLNPLIIGKENFSLTEGIKFNIGMGYTMSPFGDFIDENIWLKINETNISLYARQFENRNNWFNGFGVSISDFHFTDRISVNISGHFWEQPKNLDFNTSESFTGAAIVLDADYFFPVKGNSWLNAISINLGFLYKTKGFLPEELYLNEHFGFRVGTSIRVN